MARADSRGVTPADWPRAWDFNPLILIPLSMLAWLYCRGLVRIWKRSSATINIPMWQASAYFGGLAFLFLALLSPLDALSAELSSAHMVQHMVLMLVAAPLMVVGAPMYVIACGLPEWSRGAGSSLFRLAFRVPQDSLLWQPLFTWTLFAIALWGWHHPRMYQAALRDPLLHDAQHLSFFIAACAFWRLCLDPLSRRTLPPGPAILYLFTTSLHASALGVFLALAPRPWYGDYAGRVEVWGLSTLTDQQLAGFIMWLPSCLVFPAVAAGLLGRWLSTRSADVVRAERVVRNHDKVADQSGVAVARAIVTR